MNPETTIVRSKKRRRSVALTVEPDGSVRVLAPMRTSLSWIQDFIAGKADWIARRRSQHAQETRRKEPPRDGATVPFQGVPHTLCINREAETQPCIALTIPDGLSEAALPAEIQTELTLWYKKQARRVFAQRVAHWAAVMEVRPARLVVSAPERRWGSCSAKNDIRLNWRLIKAAPELLDYVIVHELSHIPHKNHGKRFWRMVEKYIPDAKTLRRELRGFEKLD